MDNFIVSARKYRPASFEMVVGQDTITQTLKNAITNKHLAQAYLFCGPRGVGKTTCARIFAKTINCSNLDANSEACNECESCKSFNSLRSFNIHELDAASNNKVEDIRSLNDQVRIPPQVGKYSIYIIDEVHMLSSSAFNAFLKTLEEPPAHAIFILATTEKHKIIPTILSRCQIFDFNRIRIEDIIARLKFVASNESVVAEEEALHVIAQKADGAMRDALSIFDQMVSLCGKNITYKNVIENLNVLDYEYYFKVTDSILSGGVSEVLIIFDEITSKGFDGYNFLVGLNSHFRDLLVSKDKSTVRLLETTPSVRDRYVDQALKCSIQFLYKALEIGNQFDVSFKSSKNSRLHIELALIKLCSLFSQNPDEGAEKKKPVSPLEKPENKPAPQVSSLPDKNPEPPSRAEKIVSSFKNPAADIGKIPETHRSFSIKEAMNKNGAPSSEMQITAGIAVDNTETAESLTLDQSTLTEAWKEFGERFSGDGPRAVSMFKSIEPQLDSSNHTINISLRNSDQRELFVSNYKQKMVDLIAKKFGTNNINILAEVDTSEKRDIIYSDDQKLQFLQTQYPGIKEYIKEFKLTT